MSTIVVEVTIRKPREAVYRAFMNPDLLPKWMTGFQKIDTVSGQPEQVGSKYKLTFLENGKEVVLDETVTAVRKNEEFTFEMTGSGMKSEVSVTFRDDGPNTVIRSENVFKGSNVVFSMIMPLIQGKVKQRLENDMNSFRDLVESEDF